MIVKLYDYQKEAVENLNTGSILCGGVGSGKSRTSLYYYIFDQSNRKHDVVNINLCDLYIITTARKRDTFEWEQELAAFNMSTHSDINKYGNKIVVDSWNNIAKYKDVENAFFIFDEQRVVGYGAWSKNFIKIARNNKWILLSATPGDTWLDYAPVFIANGFYKNITDFKTRHVVYSRYGNFPKVDRYIETGRLIRLRNKILVDMDFKRKTVSHHVDVEVMYDKFKYKELLRNRWNEETGEPIVNASELCSCLRKIINSDPSRKYEVLKIALQKNRVIIFYNFDYELEILKNIDYGEEFEIAEWNGHKHQPIPQTEKWIYLVQYNAGAEGWNCIKTDTIIFYSENYSYKMMQQSAGRIDRLNTPFNDLYYYHLKSKSGIDLAISKALREKKKFNERKYVDGFTKY